MAKRSAKKVPVDVEAWVAAAAASQRRCAICSDEPLALFVRAAYKAMRRQGVKLAAAQITDRLSELRGKPLHKDVLRRHVKGQHDAEVTA